MDKIILDKERCPKLYEEFNKYKYDENNNIKKEQYLRFEELPITTQMLIYYVNEIYVKKYMTDMLKSDK